MIRRILSALLAPTVADELAAIREQIGDLDSARAELDDVRIALGPHALPGRRLDDCVSALVGLCESMDASSVYDAIMNAEGYKADAKAAEAEVDRLNAKVDEIKGALSPWRKDVAHLVDAVRDLVQERQNYAKAANDLDGMIRARDAEIERLETSNKALRDKLARIEDERIAGLAKATPEARALVRLMAVHGYNPEPGVGWKRFGRPVVATQMAIDVIEAEAKAPALSTEEAYAAMSHAAARAEQYRQPVEVRRATLTPPDVVKARLDPNGTEKPLTRIVTHAKEGDCVGHGVPLVNPEHVAADGTRTPLAAITTPKSTEEVVREAVAEARVDKAAELRAARWYTTTPYWTDGDRLRFDTTDEAHAAMLSQKETSKMRDELLAAGWHCSPDAGWTKGLGGEYVGTADAYAHMLAERARATPRDTLAQPEPGDLYVDMEGDFWFCRVDDQCYCYTTPDSIRDDGKVLALRTATPEEIAKFRKDHGL